MALTTNLTYLTAARLAAEESGSPQTAQSAQEAASLAKRIKYVRQLLLLIARTNPSYARQLAPELRELRQLLHELSRRATQTQVTPSAPSSGIPAFFATSAGQPSAVLAAPPAMALSVPVPTVIARADIDAARPSGTVRHGVSTSHTPGNSPARRPLLLANPAAATGSATGVSASAAPAGAAAATLVTVSALCLCLGLLAGRLTLIMLPWRLAVLGHRLERPG
ncbi:MAG: hypothetical protein JO325_18985 [Solirubrobacterales bacterium]|nr:hypothetical protein [Solirubrobacterales bacterium]